MKKTKAKPVKGSARAKKFDAGGLAALAGLGALAYMMRKKKGGSEGSAPKDKSGYSSGPVDVRSMIEGKGDEEPSAEVKRAMATSQGRPDLIPEGATDADRATMYGDTVAKRVMPAPRRAAKLKDDVPSLPPKKGETRISTQINPPAGNENRPSKPYPKDVKGTTPSTYYTPSARSAASMIEGKGSEGAGKTQPKPATEKEAGAAKKGFGPKLTFLTPERLDKSKEAMRRAREGMNKGGSVKKYASGGSVSSASKRADGIAQRGKTKGRIC